VLRAVAYLLLGWILIALVGALADVLSLTMMLPATSAILVTHVAFSRSASTSFGLALAIALGYLEDLHQGAPIGAMTLAHALAYLVLRQTAARFALGGWVMRTAMGAAAVVLIDVAVWAILMTLAETLSVRREALIAALGAVRWHALATLLATPPVWSLVDRFLDALQISDRSPQHTYWKGR
jgi:cell shape-determining protein MreD